MIKKLVIVLLAATITVSATIEGTEMYIQGRLKRLPQPTHLRALTPTEEWKLYLFNEIASANLSYADYRIMHEIIQCESSWRQFNKDGSVILSSGNIGLAQINRSAHEKTYRAMGLDVAKPYDNLRFAVWLYKAQGTKPWFKWSGYCWNR